MDRPVPPVSPAFQDHYLRDEGEALASLIDEARLPADAAARVQARARSLVETVRSRQQAHAGMQSLLREYDLSSQEGVLPPTS